MVSQDDESGNADDKSSQGSLSSSDSSEHDSGDGSDAESSKGSNGTAESDRVQKTTLGDQVKGHKDIVEYFNSLERNGVVCGGMKSKKVQAVLGLKNAPNFCSKNHREYFYNIKTDKMKDITKLYREKK